MVKSTLISQTACIIMFDDCLSFCYALCTKEGMTGIYKSLKEAIVKGYHLLNRPFADRIREIFEV